MVIHAHPAAQATFDRHKASWEALGVPLRVCCPEDACVDSEYPTLKTGRAARLGPDSVKRFEAMFRWAHVIIN